MIGIDDWNLAERRNRFQEIVEIIDQGLRKRISSYEGNYYHIKEMTMYPEPVQKPQPPITIAALSSRMLKITAQYADNWNTIGSMGRHSSDQLLDKVKRRNEQINKYCEELGRDPESLVRSILCYGVDAFTIYDSTENFIDFVEKYREIGLSEFYFYYPFRKEQMPIFEKIAKEILPEIQKK